MNEEEAMYKRSRRRKLGLLISLHLLRNLRKTDEERQQRGVLGPESRPTRKESDLREEGELDRSRAESGRTRRL